MKIYYYSASLQNSCSQLFIKSGFARSILWDLILLLLTHPSPRSWLEKMGQFCAALIHRKTDCVLSTLTKSSLRTIFLVSWETKQINIFITKAQRRQKMKYDSCSSTITKRKKWRGFTTVCPLRQIFQILSNGFSSCEPEFIWSQKHRGWCDWPRGLGGWKNLVKILTITYLDFSILA